jgi:hypothetical protein
MGQIPTLSTSPSEMVPASCTMASGAYTRCYGLGTACADGKFPTACFDEQTAQLVACKRGKESTSSPGEDQMFSSRKKIDGSFAVYYDFPPADIEPVFCEDQARPVVDLTPDGEDADELG